MERSPPDRGGGSQTLPLFPPISSFVRQGLTMGALACLNSLDQANLELTGPPASAPERWASKVCATPGHFPFLEPEINRVPEPKAWGFAKNPEHFSCSTEPEDVH